MILICDFFGYVCYNSFPFPPCLRYRLEVLKYFPSSWAFCTRLPSPICFYSFFMFLFLLAIFCSLSCISFLAYAKPVKPTLLPLFFLSVQLWQKYDRLYFSEIANGQKMMKKECQHCLHMLLNCMFLTSNAKVACFVFLLCGYRFTLAFACICWDHAGTLYAVCFFEICIWDFEKCS